MNARDSALQDSLSHNIGSEGTWSYIGKELPKSSKKVFLNKYSAMQELKESNLCSEDVPLDRHCGHSFLAENPESLVDRNKEVKHPMVHKKSSPANATKRLAKEIVGVGSPWTPDRVFPTPKVKTNSVKKAHLTQGRQSISSKF